MSVEYRDDRAVQVLSGDAVARALARLAHQIREHHPDPSLLALIGVRTRGVPLAERLSTELERLCGVRAPVGEIDITAHRDDLPGAARSAIVDTSKLGFPVAGRSVVLVDDVLYTGRTARAAIDAIIDRGRPGRIELAVLVDRGHRELPIRADYVGKNLPSSKHEEVRVRLRETDGADGVLLVSGKREGE